MFIGEGGNRGEELKGMVREIGNGVQMDRLSYNLKYNRNMIMAVEGDMDMGMMFKENDEHEYSYVGGKDSLVRRVSKGGGATARETSATNEGRRCGTSGRRSDGGAKEDIQVEWLTRVKETVNELWRCILCNAVLV